jgi:hypothetical protein
MYIRPPSGSNIDGNDSTNIESLRALRDWKGRYNNPLKMPGVIKRLRVLGRKLKIDALVMNRPTLSDRCHDVIVHF